MLKNSLSGERICGIGPDTRPGYRAGPALVAALLAGILYAVTLGGTYVYDDGPFIRDDPRMNRLSDAGRFWTEPYHHGVDILYRPLTSLSFAAQRWVGADRPWALHGVNVLLHMGMSAVVAELGLVLGGAGVGWLAGLLFAAHPVHVEAVAGLVGRAELLCALGVLGALRLWIVGPMTVGRGLAIVGLFALAALSKEQGMLLPMVLIAAMPLRRQAQGERQDGGRVIDDQSARQKGQREHSIALLTLTAVLLGFAAYVVWRENHPAIRMSWDPSWIAWSINPVVEATGLNRWMLPVSVAGRYAGLLVAPIQLSLDYGGHVLGPAARWSDPYVWIGMAALIGAVTGAALALFKRRYDLLLLWAGLGLSYGLVNNFVLMIGTIMGERLMYLPSAFFVILAGYALRRLPRRGLWVAMGLLLALGGWRMVSYAAMWNHPVDLYRSLMIQHPESARGYRLVAQELFYAGQSKEAWEILERGLERIPDDVDFWLYTVRAALAEHDPAQALRLLDRAEQQERLRQQRLGIDRRTSLEELDNWRDKAQRMLNEEGALKHDPFIASDYYMTMVGRPLAYARGSFSVRDRMSHR